MYVIFGKDTVNKLGDKFTYLELDTFMEEGLESPVTAFAVISMDDVRLEEIPLLDNYSRMHNDMLKEYRKGNFNYCQQAMEHLRGRWQKQLDSFYDEFEQRIKRLESEPLPEGWDGTIHK